jgi:Spy/CpxP family protein refolding chaperone
MFPARQFAKECYKPGRYVPGATAYNAGMKKTVLILLLCCLAAAAVPVAAQDAPPPGQFGRGAQMREQMREQMHEMSPEQREARQQRRDTWQQMSPEDRHQLRRDIRDAGQTLYPRGRPRRAD